MQVTPSKWQPSPSVGGKQRWPTHLCSEAWLCSSPWKLVNQNFESIGKSIPVWFGVWRNGFIILCFEGDKMVQWRAFSNMYKNHLKVHIYILNICICILNILNICIHIDLVSFYKIIIKKLSRMGKMVIWKTFWSIAQNSKKRRKRRIYLLSIVDLLNG